MQAIGKFLSYTANSLDITTCANDVIVVRHADGTLRSSPFFVRFGRGHVLRPSDKIVQIEVNGEMTEAVMKMGEDGTAFWLEPTNATLADVGQLESPVGSPNRSPRVGPAPSPSTPTAASPSQQQGGTTLTVTNTATNRRTVLSPPHPTTTTTSSVSPVVGSSASSTTAAATAAALVSNSSAAQFRADASFATCLDPNEAFRSQSEMGDSLLATVAAAAAVGSGVAATNAFVSPELMGSASDSTAAANAGTSDESPLSNLMRAEEEEGGPSHLSLADEGGEDPFPRRAVGTSQRAAAAVEDSADGDADSILRDEVDPADKAPFSDLLQSMEASKLGTPLVLAAGSQSHADPSDGLLGGLGGGLEEGGGGGRDSSLSSPQHSSARFGASAVSGGSSPQQQQQQQQKRGSIAASGASGDVPTQMHPRVGSVGDLVLSRFASVDNLHQLTSSMALGGDGLSPTGANGSSPTLNRILHHSRTASGSVRGRKGSQMVAASASAGPASPMGQLMGALADGVLPPKGPTATAAAALSLASPPPPAMTAEAKEELLAEQHPAVAAATTALHAAAHHGVDSLPNTPTAAEIDAAATAAALAARSAASALASSEAAVAAVGVDGAAAIFDSDLDECSDDLDELEYGSEDDDYYYDDEEGDGAHGMSDARRAAHRLASGPADAAVHQGAHHHHNTGDENHAAMNASGGADSANGGPNTSGASVHNGTTNPPSLSATQSGGLPPLFQRTLTPIEADLKRLGLKEGANIIRYRTTSSLRGTTYIEGRIFLWGQNTKIVVSDVDGTITKSDVLGHILPLVGKDWTHTGICDLYTKCAQNGYQFLYLTARSVSYMAGTRRFLWSIVQDGKRLPLGPVLTAPDRFFAALTTEVSKRSHEFKIACLEGVRRAFPPHCRPFYAGFGNRINDVVAYSATGIPKHKIFIIDHQGVVHVCKVQQTYNHLSHLVHETFPPLRAGACVRQYPHGYATNNYPGAETALPALAIAGVPPGNAALLAKADGAGAEGGGSPSASATATAVDASSAGNTNTNNNSGTNSARGNSVGSTDEHDTSGDGAVATSPGVGSGDASVDGSPFGLRRGNSALDRKASASGASSFASDAAAALSATVAGGAAAGESSSPLPAPELEESHHKDEAEEVQDFNSFNFWRMDPRDYLGAAPSAAAAPAKKKGASSADVTSGTTAAAIGGASSSSSLPGAAGTVPVATAVGSGSALSLSNSGGQQVAAKAPSSLAGTMSSAKGPKDHILVAPSKAGKDGVSPSRYFSTVGSVRDVPPAKPQGQADGAKGLRSWLPWIGGRGASAAGSASGNAKAPAPAGAPTSPGASDGASSTSAPNASLDSPALGASTNSGGSGSASPQPTKALSSLSAASSGKSA